MSRDEIRAEPPIARYGWQASDPFSLGSAASHSFEEEHDWLPLMFWRYYTYHSNLGREALS